jgi:tetratricopeptide (TPR) repeat protein
MVHQAGVACVIFLTLANHVLAGGGPGQLLDEATHSSTDPLGVRLVRLCREHVAQTVAQQLRQEVQQVYSPRHLERLLACGNVETRRAAAFGIGLIGDARSQTPIATALRDPDVDVRISAELACRQIWARMGSAEQQEKLARIQEAAQNQEFSSAAAQAGSLIRTAPDYAEAWNERAKIYFQMNRDADSIADCQRALELNPYHFGAASGMAQCYLRLNQIPEAIAAFKLTAKLHPRLPGLEEQIQVLESQFPLTAAK